MGSKKNELEAVVQRILLEKSEISIADIASAAGMNKSDEAHRRAIRRILADLVDRGILEARGTTRARLYVVLKGPQEELKAVEDYKAFEGIPVSPEGNALLRYLSQPLKVRPPVGYNQTFLRSYIPNDSALLSEAQRDELYSIGVAESIERPAGTYARNILNRLLIDLSWNSSRLEGNTYSLLETQRLIEVGESAFGKDAAEAQMILNHKSAIEYILETVIEESITQHEICSIHALLSENLLGDPGASGRIRQIAVGVSGTNYLPLENAHSIKECFDVLIEKLNLIRDPFEQSFFALVHLSYLQAFEDVNKRTARLLANIPLIKSNLKPLSFVDVEREAYVKSVLGVYEKNDVSLFRDLYLWAYKRSVHRYSAIQQSMGPPNLLKLKYRTDIQEIIRSVILEKVLGAQLVPHIRRLIEEKDLSEAESGELFKIIETEIVSLHEGNIARFKIRPSEFRDWKKLQ